MKSLRNPADREEILRRLEFIQPTSQRRWGRMSAHNMIYHLSDGSRLYDGTPLLIATRDSAEFTLLGAGFSVHSKFTLDPEFLR